MRHEVARARELLMAGGPLAAMVDKRLSRDIMMFAGGGLAILRAIEQVDYDVSVAARRWANWITCAWDGGRCGGGLKPESIAVAPMPAADAALREDYARCASITRRSSSNFYYAFMLLPAERRQALYSVYAFCRFVR